MWVECKVKIPNINRKHSAKNFSCQQKKQKIHNKQFSVLVESRMHTFLMSAGNTVPTSFDVRTKYRAKIYLCSLKKLCEQFFMLAETTM